MPATVKVDVADRMNVLVDDSDVVGSLKDLKWIRHVGDTGDPGHQAFHLGIFRSALLEILRLLLQGPWLIRDFIAFYDTLPRGYTTPGTMVLDVPCRRVDHLPDAR